MKEQEKIAILITTFMRDDLLIRTVNTILKNWDDRFYILIGDQGSAGSKEWLYKKLKNQKKGKVIYLPFDCGLSHARNQLVTEAYYLSLKYVLLSADSIQFTNKYDFQPIIDFLNTDKDRGIVGFHLDGSKGDWYRDLELIPGKYFQLNKPTREAIGDFQPVDIVKNFFLAKTDCLLDNPWDRELCLCEHEDFAYRLKTETNWKVFYYPKLSALHVTEREGEYAKFRNRCYNEFQTKLKQKYGITGWVRCDK